MEEDQEERRPNNALLFRLAVTNSFKRVAESVSEEEFLRTLTILNTNPNVAQKLHKAMIKELYESMNSDLEDILNEGSLQDALANVCKLSESADASEQESFWRPPGNVELHLRSLDAHKITEESKKLAVQVQAIENENATLMKEVLENRSKVCAAHDSITRSLHKSPVALERLDKRLEQLENCLKVLEGE